MGFQDPRTVYWASDINALVSLEEGFGLVVIEAAMTGLPPLRSRSAGADDQVTHGQTGLLVDAKSVDTIVAELDKLVTNKLYREQLGDSANASARAKYSLDVMAEQVEGVYREAVAESRNFYGSPRQDHTELANSSV